MNTSKKLMNSDCGSFSKELAMIRCAVEEMGRNSVTPSTSPKMIEFRPVIRTLYRLLGSSIISLMKVALVHDHLFEFGGAERVFLALKRILPDADVYTAAFNPQVLKQHAPDYQSWNLTTSWASRIPFFSKLYSPLRFLAPRIWESFDLSEYDLVISSSGWFMSKGVITKEKTFHICYLHHQPRYLYNYETAMDWQKHLPIRIYAHFVNHFLRVWDFQASQRPDQIIVNSEETKKRVKKFYRRDATVIYPPVAIPKNHSITEGDITSRDYYVTVSRLSKAKNANAFLFASVDEEFGIAPVEAMGYGVPVIAYASGGLKETIKDGKNGYLYDKLETQDLLRIISKIESLSHDNYTKMVKNARKEAEKYSFEIFRSQILKAISHL